MEAIFKDSGARWIWHQLQHGRISRHCAATAFQPPFATAATNIQATPGESDAAERISRPQPDITNSYAVNPNYRMGYVQIRNLDIQQQIRPTLLVEYRLHRNQGNGSRHSGSAKPNREREFVFPGLTPSLTKIRWQIRRRTRVSVRLRKRLARGFSIGGTYTFSKSLDDASSIGAGATSGASTPGLGAGGTGAAGGTATTSAGAANVAQNPFNLSAERGLSSFNQTHKFTADYLLELPFGHDKRWLTGNTPWRAILGDWQWSGDWTIASGLPFTPRVLGNVNDVNAGTNGTLRPDLVPGQSVSLAHPSIARVVQYRRLCYRASGGTVRQCSAQQHHRSRAARVFDMAFTKIVPLKESRMLEFRAQATNIFNIPNYSSIDTSVTSPDVRPGYGGRSHAAIHDDGPVSVLRKHLQRTLTKRIVMISKPNRFANKAVAVLLTFVLLCATSPSQQQDYLIHVQSELVLVNVTVRDKSGNFVQGLKPENFTILEDNKPQKVVSFDVEKVDAVPPADVAQAKPLPAAPSVATTPTAAPDGASPLSSAIQRSSPDYFVL